MNQVVEEMKAILEDDYLMHYGTKYHSGRYPYGSGEDPYQHEGDFLTRVERMRKEGFTFTDEDGKTWKGDTAIAKSMNMSTSDFRKEVSWANYTRRELNVSRAKNLQSKGMGATEIGREMGVSESTVRSWLNPNSEAKMQAAKKTADFLKEQVDSRGMIDVGINTEKELNISREKLELALYALESEGYVVHKNRMEQVTNRGNWTTQMVLCPPGTPAKDAYDLDKVHSLTEYVSHDNGETFDKLVYPKSMDSKRLMIRYKDDVGPDGATGDDKDGVIELRRGVEDLSLGDARYSQVRILVDNNKYLKGMAVYSDNMPDGVDVVFNTNKTHDVAKMDVLKDIKTDDPDNPFGALIKKNGQSYYVDKDGNRQLSLINKKSDEGDWSDWQDALPSQFLSKQSLSLAKRQLDIAAADKIADFNDICSLDNPTIKKHLLASFADDCDGAAVNLKAAALPGQKYHVIIPVNSLKDNEVYAPGYEDGTKLALIRYPHGGTFEIPILTVNNKNATAKNLIGTDTMDAVGITKKNADRLSGADFDGDTVMCIPTHDKMGRVRITSTDELKDLKGFDPKTEYATIKKGDKYYNSAGEEVPIMTKHATQLEMGKISNLITDMTLSGGATDEEKARAVKHSMVVIDANKHKLDYKRSEVENGISALVNKYQIKSIDEDGNVKAGGASTIISRAKSKELVPKRRGNPVIDPETGEKSYKLANADDLYYVDRKYDKKAGTITLRKADGKRITYSTDDAEAVEKYTPVRHINKETGEVTYTNKAGDISYRVRTRTQNSTKMAEAKDAYELVSAARHPMEIVYADYANQMKALANKARKTMMSTGRIEYSPSAAKTYANEVNDLLAQLNDAEKNAPRERQAQRLANAEVKRKMAANPNMESGDIKKASQQALTKYRQQVGTISRKDRAIKITDRAWEAIQAGAISEARLTKILKYTDIDSLRERATPRTTIALSPAKVNRIKSMSASNLSISQIANALGVSTSTVYKYLNPGKE